MSKSSMFRGKTTRSLDTKGRLMLPPEFREILLARSEAGIFTLTTYDECIVGFTQPDWEEFEQSMSEIHNAVGKVRNFKRLVLGGQEQMTFDAQGRIRIPKSQLAYAGISSEAVVMGQGTRFEIWQPERLNAAISGDFDDVSESLPDSVSLLF